MTDTAEQTVKAKYPKAVALNSSVYKGWVILENQSSNHVLNTYTGLFEQQAWADAAARIEAKGATSHDPTATD